MQSLDGNTMGFKLYLGVVAEGTQEPSGRTGVANIWGMKLSAIQPSQSQPSYKYRVPVGSILR